MLRGSHIDVFDGLIKLCISVARVNTDSIGGGIGSSEEMVSSKVVGKCKVDQHRQLPWLCRRASLLSPTTSTFSFSSSIHNAEFRKSSLVRGDHMVSRIHVYCVSFARETCGSGPRTDKYAEPFIRLQGSTADRATTEPCELYSID